MYGLSRTKAPSLLQSSIVRLLDIFNTRSRCMNQLWWLFGIICGAGHRLRDSLFVALPWPFAQPLLIWYDQLAWSLLIIFLIAFAGEVPPHFYESIQSLGRTMVRKMA